MLTAGILRYFFMRPWNPVLSRFLQKRYRDSPDILPVEYLKTLNWQRRSIAVVGTSNEAIMRVQSLLRGSFSSFYRAYLCSFDQGRSAVQVCQRDQRCFGKDWYPTSSPPQFGPSLSCWLVPDYSRSCCVGCPYRYSCCCLHCRTAPDKVRDGLKSLLK